MAYQHIKRYQNFFGVDYKTNDLDFADQFATEVDNVSFSASGTLEKRKGIQAYAEPGAKFGIFTYNRIDEDGVEQAEVLGCSNTVSKLSTTTLTVTYSGANPVVNFSLFYDPADEEFCAHIEEGTTVKLNQLLGVGRDEAVPYTVAQLKTAIDSIVGGLFSATISGDSSVPAAFLKTTKVTSFASSAIAVSATYWDSINVSPQTLKAGPLQGSETNKNEANFQNVTSAQLQNCIYFSNGYDPVLKYDGQNLYRAGLPPASDGSTGAFAITASGAAGPGSPAVPNVYVWRQQFIQIDNNGNQIEGNTSNSPEYNLQEPTLSPLNTVTVTVTNIQAGSGFNTNCALITATATGTAIPVSVGHTMKAGDTAYLWNTATSSYETRSVISVGATTVTVNSPISYTNSVTNNQNVISNNLRIRILRNKNSNLSIPGVSPTLWFEVIEIPNNSFTANSTFGDTTPDASLFTQFLEPATDRSPPQPGKYISAYQNLMVTAGNIESPNEVSFSDVANPEYFPRVAAQFTVTNLQGDIISGIHPSTESFIIFQKRAIHAVTGDVPNQNFRVDILTQDIGCASHASIQDLRGTIVFLSNVGPRVMSGNALPRGLGSAIGNELNSRIDPLFLQVGKPEEELFRTQRAIGFNDRKNERYLLYVPAETVESGERFANENSRVLVYDYTRDAWISWSNLNMHGGITSFNEDKEIYFVERRDSDLVIPTTDIKHYLYRFLDTNTFLDYEDHDEPVALTYKSKWEFMGETALLKNFLRIRVYSAELIDSDFILDIETEKDFTADSPVSICSLDFGSVGYGDGAWDTGPWGDPSSPAIKHKLSNGRAISLRVIFKNSEAQKNIAITGYELEVALPYAPGFKK
jgi:hypothetical protein